jgi:hypothetical protein
VQADGGRSKKNKRGVWEDIESGDQNVSARGPAGGKVPVLIEM